MAALLSRRAKRGIHVVWAKIFMSSALTFELNLGDRRSVDTDRCEIPKSRTSWSPQLLPMRMMTGVIMRKSRKIHSI